MDPMFFQDRPVSPFMCVLIQADPFPDDVQCVPPSWSFTYFPVECFPSRVLLFLLCVWRVDIPAVPFPASCVSTVSDSRWCHSCFDPWCFLNRPLFPATTF